MVRREAIVDIMDKIDDEIVVCNIGFPSRELYDIDDRDKNFYMILVLHWHAPIRTLLLLMVTDHFL